MRGSVLMLAVLATMLVPSVASTGDLDKTAFVYSTTNTHGDTILGWTPVALARSYLVYRGPDSEHLRLLGEVPELFYHDMSAQPNAIVVYGVAASFGDHASPIQKVQTSSSSGASCVATSGPSGASVNAQSCVSGG